MKYSRNKGNKEIESFCKLFYICKQILLNMYLSINLHGKRPGMQHECR